MPALFVTIIFGWMLIIARGKDSSHISISAFGINVGFEASKIGFDRRVSKPTDSDAGVSVSKEQNGQN